MARTIKSDEQAIKDLRQSLAWSDLVMATLDEGVLTVGDDMRVRFVNDAAAELVNKPRVLLLGLYIWEAVQLFDNGNLLKRKHFLDALRERRENSFSKHTHILKCDNKTLTVDVAIGYIPKIKQAVFVIRDVTQREIAEKDHIKLAEESIARIEAQKAAKKISEREERFRLLIENSTDAIALIDKEGKFVYVSPAVKNILGYTPKELLGKDTNFLFPKGHLKEIQNKFQPLFQKSGAKVSVEHKFVHKDGSIRWMENRMTNLLSTSTVKALVSNFRDITQEQQALERQNFLVQASTILGASIDYETTLKNLGELIIPFLADYCRIVILDENKQIKEITVNHVNRRQISLVKELYNAYKDDPENEAGVGRLIRTGKIELMSKITPEALKNSNSRVIKLIEELNLKSYMGAPMKIGNRIVGAITFSSIRKSRPYTIEDLALAQELARRAAFAIENARLYTEAQKAIALRDEFISVASHELKTPVTSLKIYAQITKKQAEDKGQDVRNMEKMEAQINKLTILIQDLLNVSKFQSGKLEYHDGVFDLGEVVEEVVDMIQLTTRKHSIQINGSIKHPVWGDRDRIGQVVANLLNNAIKYSPEANKIIVSLNSKRNAAVVTVQDFGIGIDKQHLGKLFERFYRVTTAEEKTFPGLGLGLYISNEIIKRYGGKISVESNKGKGSQFSFTLPYNHRIVEISNNVPQKSVSL